MGICKFVWYFITLLLDFIFSLYYRSKRQYLTPSNNPTLIRETGVSLAKKIRNKTISCEEIVQAFITRIEEINNIINGVVDNRFEAAIKEAKAIDAGIKNGSITSKDFDEKPFLGVPFTTKESTACEGLRNTYGLVARRYKKATEDAEVVRLMKKAGGILLGVCNVPQLNMAQETNNPVYGRTNNPYDTTRNAGGSTGGDAAMVSAGAVPIAIGTDIGGSVRIPSFHCGLFGHKPTNGLISTRGLTGRTGLEKDTMVTPGPIVKTADDIAPLLKVLVDKNVKKLKLDETVDVQNLKVYYALETGDSNASPFTEEMKDAILKVIKHFEGYSKHSPKEFPVPELKFGIDLWRYQLANEDTPPMKQKFTDMNGEVNLPVEILKFLVGQSNINIFGLLALYSETVPVKDSKWAEDMIQYLVQELTSKLGDTGVLLFPSSPMTSNYHYASILRHFDISYFCIWNALKFPVTQVPIGVDSNGLPLGIQVVAAPYQDHLCIAVAKELERAFGGYVTPYTTWNINNWDD